MILPDLHSYAVPVPVVRIILAIVHGIARTVQDLHLLSDPYNYSLDSRGKQDYKALRVPHCSIQVSACLPRCFGPAWCRDQYCATVILPRYCIFLSTLRFLKSEYSLRMSFWMWYTLKHICCCLIRSLPRLDARDVMTRNPKGRYRAQSPIALVHSDASDASFFEVWTRRVFEPRNPRCP